MPDLIPFDGELDAVPAAAPVAAAAVPTAAVAAPAAPVALTPFTGTLDPVPAVAPAAAVEPPKPERSVLGEIGHQVGLAGRAVVQGAAALPGMVSDAATGVVNAGLDAYTDARAPTVSELVTGQKEKGFRFEKVSSALGNIMDQTGVAKPENATERVVQDAATGAATALTGAGVAQTVAKAAAGPITKALSSALAAAPGMQAVSGATGAGASGAVREAGGGAVAQGVAGLAGALAPTVVPFAAQAGVRGALRGGEAGRQQVADNIATFEEAAGTTPTLGQATQSRALQGAETGLSNVVGSSGIMVRRGEQQADALAKSVEDLTARLAPTASGADAGEAIARGVANFRDNVRNTQERLYNALDQHIAPEAPINVSNTRAAMEELNAGIDGAPALSKWFKNARIQGLEGAMRSDTEGTAAVLSRPGMEEAAAAVRQPLEAEVLRANAANTRRVDQFRSSLEADAAQAATTNADAVASAAQLRSTLEARAAQIAEENAQRRLLGIKNNTKVPTPQEIADQVKEFQSSRMVPVVKKADIDRQVREFRASNMEPVPTKADIDAHVDDFLKSQVTGRMPYESIKKMRTLVGREMSDANFTSEISRDKWSKLYAALSEDLGVTAKEVGPQAQQAWARANRFTRLASERMEQISSIVNKDAPEKIFKAATSGLADGGTQINRLMKSMPVENRREVAAAVLQRLGRAKPGQQNELGDAFSSETFLSNLANLSPAARKALFNTSGFPGLESKITLMGRMASNRREGSKVFANPSGTARQGAMIGWAAGLGTALATGNSGAVAAALAAPVLARSIAKATTAPSVVRFAARTTQANEAAVPAAIAAAARIPTEAGERPGLRRMREGRAARLSGGS